MTTIQPKERFELQYQHNGIWLDRNSGATEYFQAFSPNDLLFDSYQSALRALHEMENIGMSRDNLRVVGVDLADED
jgi:hypothetical protein